MILINIEGNLIENMIIQDNELLFSDIDSENNTIYTPEPTNEYVYDTYSYNIVQIFLYHPEYLGFYSNYNINKFKNYCLENHIKNIDFFKYNGLSICLEEIDGDV